MGNARRRRAHKDRGNGGEERCKGSRGIPAVVGPELVITASAGALAPNVTTPACCNSEALSTPGSR